MEKIEQIEQTPGQEGFSTSEVAARIGYTRQSVSNAMKELGLEVKKTRRGYRLTAQQADAIAKYFGAEASFEDKTEEQGQSQESEQDQEEPLPQHPNNSDIEKMLIESFERQLAAKDKQIEELNELIKATQQQIDRAQEQIDSLLETNKALSAAQAVTTAADKKEILLAEKADEPKKKGFFARLFG